MMILPVSLPLCSFLSSAWCALSWSWGSWTALSFHATNKTKNLLEKSFTTFEKEKFEYLTENFYHLDEKLDRKSSQSVSLSTRQFVPPWWLVNKRVIVLLVQKMDNSVSFLYKQVRERELQDFKISIVVAVWCLLNK